MLPPWESAGVGPDAGESECALASDQRARHRASVTPRLLPRLALLLAALLFSTGGAAIKFTELDAWQVASWRSGLACLVLLALSRAARSGWNRRLFAVAVPYAATMILFVQANRHTTAASTTFLQSGAPFYILLLGPLFLGERRRRGDGLALALMLLGMGLLWLEPRAPQATAPHPWLGNLLATLSGLSWALTLLALRGVGRSGGAPLAAVASGNLLTCVVALPLALRGIGPAEIGWPDLGAILWLGVFQIALAYVCLGAALRRVPALEASLLMLPELFFSPYWAWLVHREEPGSRVLLGGAVLLAATLVRIRIHDAEPEPG